MKITGARTAACAAGGILALSTDEGVTGFAPGASSCLAQARRLCTELLEGEDPRATAGLWQRLSAAPGADPGSAAVLDLALWDLKARINDEPLWRTLGGSRPHVPAYASAGAIEDAALSGWCRALANGTGIRGVSLAASADPDQDLERFGIVRSTFAGTTPPVLMIEMPPGSSPADSIRHLRALETRLDLAWISNAAAPWDALGLRRVSRAVAAAVCAGRGLSTPAGFLPCFQHRAMDVVQIDLQRHGISGALQLADAAYGFELPVTLCAMAGNVQVQLGGALPYVMNAELAPLPAEPAPYATDVRVRDGFAIAGDAPGNGLSIRWERFDRMEAGA